MPTADRDDLDVKACPFCGKVGGLTWDYASRSVRCSYCYVSGIDQDEIGSRPKAVAKPKQEPSPPPAEKQKHVVDQTQTVDAYRDEKGKPVYLVYYHRLDLKPPELYVSLKRAMFHRWRLQEQIRNEARYGRDDLRKRGFVVTERTKVNGRVIKIMEPKPQDDS